MVEQCLSYTHTFKHIAHTKYIHCFSFKLLQFLFLLDKSRDTWNGGGGREEDIVKFLTRMHVK